MAAFLLAQTSDNDGGGALLSLWFLLGLFIIVAAVLWVIYARPHQRVPPRPAARTHGATATASATDRSSTPRATGADDAGDQR